MFFSKNKSNRFSDIEIDQLFIFNHDLDSKSLPLFRKVNETDYKFIRYFRKYGKQPNKIRGSSYSNTFVTQWSLELVKAIKGIK